MKKEDKKDWKAPVIKFKIPKKIIKDLDDKAKKSDEKK